MIDLDTIIVYVLAVLMILLAGVVGEDEVTRSSKTCVKSKDPSKCVYLNRYDTNPWRYRDAQHIVSHRDAR